MSYKCILAPHYRIPPPILSILVGRLPQVSTIIEDVTEEAAAAESIKLDESADDQGDAWDKDWGWSVDETPKSPSPDDHITSSNSYTSDYAHAFSPLTEPYMVSTSAGGGYMVLAHRSKFVVIELKEEEGEYCALGQGSGCEMEGQMFVMAGYNTGWLRLFSETGTMLTAQLLEPTPILSIKVRTPPPVYKTAANQSWQDEEITLLFQGNKVVSIDGQSLWMVLRVCDGQRESGIDSSRMHTAFTYKKYEFQKHDQVKDVVSLGPSPPRSTPTTVLEQSSTLSTIPFPSTATSRYIAVGCNPMLCYYATTDSSRPLMSAVSMASYVVSRVATPVFSFAKSWWSGGNSSSASSTTSPAPYVPDMHAPPTHIEPATPIPVVLTLGDPDRRITSISVAPASTSSQRSTLAATTDLLGRVILWDLQSGEMIRMWKGIRDAVCGWVEISQDNPTDLSSNQRTGPARVPLFLVIYSERRGLLLVFHMRHGAKVGIFRIGQGWRLVPCGREPLGSSMVSADRRRTAMLKDEGECGCLSKCLLIGPDGEVRNIQIVSKQS
ncbi:Rab3 GTPase-activating protein regulatory subunit N-terminus-domain-containing protein [Phascolomyces articulosus]|uniref:Rab3 GTPase-activating protein regulatory subunit N-terminus-domain-containing protein n=1 Tax=Phascolomyces articulosus TaxID=60185 RepID=A0AAD5KPM5_9FUNG|nr:Rab3 GTPase-activating protein regulatory subunit N-terminus-domain-containing protein [Phascolomyces articulosus]